jgi:superfamily II DNA/RNA helicase
VRRLAERFLSDPAQIEVARPATMAEGVEGFLVRSGSEDKRQALLDLIRDQDITKAIVFCNRKRDVSSLNRFLQQRRVNARDIHGDLEQVHRQATLDAFKAGEVDFLVATDVAARGLDISDMPCVINFDVPFNPEDYVHRIGRTGRAGKKGRAFTFETPAETKLVAAIERLTGKPIARVQPARTVDPVLADQPEIEAPPAPAPRARKRRVAAEPRPVERRPATAHYERPAAPAAARGGRRARVYEAPESAVLAFGGHVPSFLLRPVPLAKAKAEAEAG